MGFRNWYVLKTLYDYKCNVTSLFLISNNKKIISSYGSEIKIWDMELGYCLNTLNGSKNVFHLCFLTKDNEKIFQII